MKAVLSIGSTRVCHCIHIVDHLEEEKAVVDHRHLRRVRLSNVGTVFTAAFRESVTRDGVRMDFPEHVDTILNWTELLYKCYLKNYYSKHNHTQFTTRHEHVDTILNWTELLYKCYLKKYYSKHNHTQFTTRHEHVDTILNWTELLYKCYLKNILEQTQPHAIHNYSDMNT